MVVKRLPIMCPTGNYRTLMMFGLLLMAVIGGKKPCARPGRRVGQCPLFLLPINSGCSAAGVQSAVTGATSGLRLMGLSGLKRKIRLFSRRGKDKQWWNLKINFGLREVSNLINDKLTTMFGLQLMV